MSLPTLSVVVPNYNHGAYLPRCLDALLGQSAPPSEVIVIDDASTDNSMEILNRYAREHSNLHVYRNEKNQGALYSLNRGMDLAKGDYVFFPGADDVVQAGLFEKSLRVLAEHPEAALSCTASKWHDMRTGLEWYMAAGMADKPGYISPVELVRLGKRGKLLIVTASAIYRRQPLCEAGRFIQDFSYHCDWYASFVTAFRYGICYIPEPLSDFFLHATSWYNKGRKSREHFQVLDRLLERLSSPGCADVAPRIRDSASLALFGMPILRLLMRQSAYRQFLTPLLVARAARRSGEVLGKKILPLWLARWCLNRFYRAPKS